MSVYVLMLVGHDEDYERLVTREDAAKVVGELENLAAAQAVHLHVAWPHDGQLDMLVEADRDPDDLGALVAEQLGPGGWRQMWQNKPNADDPPASVEGGQRSAWVVSMAVPPEGRRCEKCKRVGVPPHHPNCAFARDDDGPAIADETAALLDPRPSTDEEQPVASEESERILA